MFGKNGNAGASTDKAVTILGPRVDVTGNITFSGYLRVQGRVVGDVACNSESHGTTVVHGAGSVTGAVTSPNIVVGGAVQGHLNAAESIEIHAGARVVGDARYRQICVQQGGVIEGSLIPLVPEGDHHRLERRVAVSDSPAIKEIDISLPSDRRATDKLRVRPGLRVLAALLVAVVAVLMLRRMPEDVPQPPVAAVEPETPAKVAESAVPPPVVEEPASTPKPAEPPPAPPAPEPAAAAPAAKAAATVRSPGSLEVATVQGSDPEKPSAVFFVNTREPSVLFKKRQDADGEGTRIELAAGAKRRFSINDGEVVRVAEGQGVEVFYQGRKVSPATVERGVWIRFVPLAGD